MKPIEAREFRIDTWHLNHLKENPNVYFPTLQISNLDDVIKMCQSSRLSLEEIEKRTKCIQFPKKLRWTIPVSNSPTAPLSSTSPPKRRVSQEGRAKMMIALSVILFFNVIGCLFFMISKRQISVINPARKIALNAVLSFSIIGLTFLGIKGFQLWKSTKNQSGSLSTRSNEEGLGHDKANVQGNEQYQAELQALRLLQYYTLMYEHLVVLLPGGRVNDTLKGFYNVFPFLLKKERVFSKEQEQIRVLTPEEFEERLQDKSFVDEYRQFLEHPPRTEGLRWVEEMPNSISHTAQNTLSNSRGFIQ
jgi:hypothetical protein